MAAGAASAARTMCLMQTSVSFAPDADSRSADSRSLRQGVVLTDLQPFLDCQYKLSLSLSLSCVVVKHNPLRTYQQTTAPSVHGDIFFNL
jgi:hypothetical protein